jgi:hypothetical protein
MYKFVQTQCIKEEHTYGPGVGADTRGEEAELMHYFETRLTTIY